LACGGELRLLRWPARTAGFLGAGPHLGR
jgi:hypothetical protein